MFDNYTPLQAETYLAAAGEPKLTKTHGRKPVAGLNYAINMFYWLNDPYDERQLFQPHISHILNKDLCHAAGFEGRDYGHPWEFFRKGMLRIGVQGL
jgi:hypothetical protein